MTATAPQPEPTRRALDAAHTPAYAPELYPGPGAISSIACVSLSAPAPVIAVAGVLLSAGRTRKSLVRRAGQHYPRVPGAAFSRRSVTHG
jgi:hypothetical protein